MSGLPELVASFYRKRLKALTYLFLTSMAPVNRSRERFGPTFAGLSRESVILIVVSYFYFPVLTRSGAAARLPYLRPSPSKPVHPHMFLSSRQVLISATCPGTHCPLHFSHCVSLGHVITFIVELLADTYSKRHLHQPIF